MTAVTSARALFTVRVPKCLVGTQRDTPVTRQSFEGTVARPCCTVPFLWVAQGSQTPALRHRRPCPLGHARERITESYTHVKLL